MPLVKQQRNHQGHYSEDWHDFVATCVDNGWGGIENLALIPGSVGAAPIQNIGAYGVELQDVFVSLEAMDWETGDVRVYFKDDCAFGYRDSLFKGALKDKVIVVSVNLRLSKMPQVNTSYGAIEQKLAEKGIDQPGIRDVFDTVIEIRQSKLPDPAEIGNAGSFFKNVELPKQDADALLEKYPDAPHYIVSDTITKIPSAWLIDQGGWKGFRDGGIGVHDKQALVLVNHGGGSGASIRDLAEKIREDVYEKFGIRLTPEVNIID